MIERQKIEIEMQFNSPFSSAHAMDSFLSCFECNSYHTHCECKIVSCFSLHCVF